MTISSDSRSAASHATDRGVSRRLFLGGLAAASCAAVTPVSGSAQIASALKLDILREPHLARVFVGESEATAHMLERKGDDWSAAGVDVSIRTSNTQVSLSMRAPSVPVQRVHLRWNCALKEGIAVLGDAWERSYGELAWLPLQAERVLPWYMLLHDGENTCGVGVRTGAGAFAFWQADAHGVSLWLDTRNGSNGVMAGDRSVTLATVVMQQGESGQSAFAVTRLLCQAMAPAKPLATTRGGHPLNAVYGSNDWYYAYGQNTAEGILRDADLMRELAPAGGTRPFTVVDDGYQDPSRFPSMAKLAADIRKRDVVPGVWIRPLRASASVSSSLLLPAAHWGARKDRAEGLVYDPTIPEARAAALAVVKEACGWGYELIKHDFTTYELLGQWGNEMGGSPTIGNWHFHDRTQTNAEIISSFYSDIRAAAGEDRIIVGCNTVGHLSAGIFDAQRTGDDVSGRTWERTRRTGVNTLAFRLPQQHVFFANDADCVPFTKDIPWDLTREWLEAVAATGTVLLVSPEPGAVGPEQKQAIRKAFALCASGAADSEPKDWLATRTPTQWGTGKPFVWTGPEGADPFHI